MATERNVLLSLFDCLIEYIFIFPLVLIAGFYMIGTSLLWSWLLFLIILMFVGVFYRVAFSRQPWWLFFIVSLGTGFLTGLLFFDGWIHTGPVMLLHIIFIYRGMMHGDATESLRIPIPHLGVGGFLIYFVAYFVFRFVDLFRPYLPAVTVGGLILVSVTLLLANQKRLHVATLSDKKSPIVDKDIKKKNSLFLGVILGVAFLIANAHVIQQKLWSGIKKVVQWFSGIQSSPEGELKEDPSGGTEETPDLPFGDKKSGTIAKFLETVMTYLLYVLIAAAIILLVLLMMKKTRERIARMYHAIVRFLRQMVYRKQADEQVIPYTDEKESLFSWKDWAKERKQGAKGFLNRFKRGPKWHAMSNEQKVRFVYRQLLLHKKDDFNYRPADTPKEALAKLTSEVQLDEVTVQKLRRAYEKTRYGKEHVDDETTDAIRLLIRKNSKT